MTAPRVGNGTVNGFHNEDDVKTLQKTLTFVDLETGLRNRALKRDPISGLGTGGSRQSPRAQSLGRRGGLNAKLISWDADAPPSAPVPVQQRRPKVPVRNPIACTGEMGEEVDLLRTTNRPRSKASREPNRNPIAGLGDFGDREWDPVWKHDGRVRRSKSSNTLRSDPLTGRNVKTFELKIDERPRSQKRHPSERNAITGVNCDSFGYQPGMRPPSRNGTRSVIRNTITGENCEAFDINSEVSTPRRRMSPKRTNPLSGDNTNSYTFSHEERQRTAKPYVYTNTLTGENVNSYKIIPSEKNLTPREVKNKPNPLSGENVTTYTYRTGERQSATKRRDISSPITGDGSRGQTYSVFTEERPRSGGASENLVRARSQGSLRNILTGENCDTFSVNREMRSERSQPRMHHASPITNIIAGL